jgi:hypothetical protein
VQQNMFEPKLLHHARRRPFKARARSRPPTGWRRDYELMAPSAVPLGSAAVLGAIIVLPSERPIGDSGGYDPKRPCASLAIDSDTCTMTIAPASR